MVNNWQQWRNSNRTIALEHLQNRFLFPMQNSVAQENDPLGPLPEGWGKYSSFRSFTEDSSFIQGHTDFKW